jgi:hypothetical protein
MSEKLRLIVHKQWLPFRIVLTVFLTAGIAFSVLAFITTRDLRGRAVPLESPSPQAFYEVPADLSAPYIRLATDKKQYAVTDKVKIDVLMHTNGQAVVESTFAILYDETKLTLGSEDIKSSDIFKTIQVSHDEKGKLLVSLFVLPQLGDTPVVLSNETKVATLTFTVSAVEPTSTEVKLLFEKGSPADSALIPPSPDRNAQSILEAVDGADITITL